MNKQAKYSKDIEIENRLTVTNGERGGDNGGKDEGFAGTIIKDTWPITRGVETGRDMGRGGR